MNSSFTISTSFDGEYYVRLSGRHFIKEERNEQDKVANKILGCNALTDIGMSVFRLNFEKICSLAVHYSARSIL